MVNLRRVLPTRLKSALTDLGIITAYEALDWIDDVVAKLFPGVGEVPEEMIDQAANVITLGFLTGAPRAYEKLYGEKITRQEYVERLRKYGRAALTEAGEVVPLTDLIPAYHLAWAELYLPREVTKGIKKILHLRDYLRRKE